MTNNGIKQLTVDNISEIRKLYIDACWQAYLSPEDLLEKCYLNALISFGYYVDGELAGIVRVVGDGVSIVYIQDLIVLEAHKRKQIGTQLMKHVLALYSNVRQITLLTDDVQELKDFYTSLGFKDSNELGMKSFYRI